MRHGFVPKTQKTRHMYCGSCSFVFSSYFIGIVGSVVSAPDLFCSRNCGNCSFIYMLSHATLTFVVNGLISNLLFIC